LLQFLHHFHCCRSQDPRYLDSVVLWKLFCTHTLLESLNRTLFLVLIIYFVLHSLIINPAFFDSASTAMKALLSCLVFRLIRFTSSASTRYCSGLLNIAPLLLISILLIIFSRVILQCCV
jgi:hypothetical protein